MMNSKVLSMSQFTRTHCCPKKAKNKERKRFKRTHNQSRFILMYKPYEPKHKTLRYDNACILKL